MPTSTERAELRKSCSWAWTTQNGVNGYRVTGPNGNSIFLPAAGYRNETDVDNRGSHGYYWSSSLNSDYSYSADHLGFRDSYYGWDSQGYRCNGFSVRPVIE